MPNLLRRNNPKFIQLFHTKIKIGVVKENDKLIEPMNIYVKIPNKIQAKSRRPDSRSLS